MNVDRLSVEVPTRAPTGRTSCYVLGREGALLVDPPATDERIEARLDDIDHVAVTHHHPDHVGAVAEYARRAGATVWCRYGREGAFADATGVEPDRTFQGGTAIETGSGPITVHDTPGHAREHVAFATPGGLVSGDLAVAAGSVVVAPPEGDVRAYLTSLRRVYGMNPDRLYPGHGPVVEDARDTCRRLIEHRLRRERRVLEAVRSGGRTVDEIVDRAYDKDLAGVRDLAGGTVRAHLLKLDREGRVEWDGTRAEPT